MKKRVLTASLLLLAAAQAVMPQRAVSAGYNDPAASQWADSVFNSMDAERRVGQLIAQVVDPRNLNAAKSTVKRLVENYNIGFIYFSEGTLDNHAELANYANAVSQLPVMVGLDGEWGLSMRMDDTPRFPKNMTLGAIQDDRLLYDYGKEMAAECRMAGVNLNFAPAVDVNSNPSNPVIGTRSFGEDPHNVARKAVAYAKGLEDNGVLSSAKHFPGHGDTDKDSHKTLPVVNRSLIELQSTELVPFRSYIRAGLSGVMVGHLNVPALKTGDRPTSQCEQVATKLLKDDMGFKGLVFTDALQMRGAHMDGKTNGVSSMMAGLLPGPTPRAGLPEEYAALTMPGPPVARMMSAERMSSEVMSRDGTSTQSMQMVRTTPPKSTVAMRGFSLSAFSMATTFPGMAKHMIHSF